MLSKNELKRIQKLHRKKYRLQEGLFLAEGAKVVRELMDSSLEIVAVYSDSEDWLDSFPSSIRVTTDDLNKAGTLSSSNDVLAIVRIPQMIGTPKGSRFLVLDGVNDPGNMGTLIRTAEWFAFDGVLCSSDSVEVYSPKVVTSAKGSLFRVAVWQGDLPAIISNLRAENPNFRLIGAEMKGTSLNTFRFPEAFGLVMGSESHGIRVDVQELLDESVTIQGSGKTESLNVGVAGGILMSSAVADT